MKPAPPEGWVNKMDDLDEKKPKKKMNEGATWHSGLLACCSDKKSACIGCFAPCLLFGMAKHEIGEGLYSNAMSMLCVLNPCFLLCFFRENVRAQYAIVRAPSFPHQFAISYVGPTSVLCVVILCVTLCLFRGIVNAQRPTVSLPVSSPSAFLVTSAFLFPEFYAS